ncbi:MAG: DNA-3-methyladenine glycosylase 2 family protein [Acetobacter sp.]|nr:DNA-3-methyladenine glycosylase 2 family protein [Acetobacter sp.]
MQRISPPSHHDLLRHLKMACPPLGAFAESHGPCTLTGNDGLEPFDALVRAIVYQQLAGRAADAIYGRLMQLEGGIASSPSALAAAPFDLLRGCGLSASKIAALQGIAQARIDGIIPDSAEAEHLSNEEIVTRLIPLRGIGRWTAEMLLMFSLGRPDVMPVDDFGVREGWRILHDAEKQLRPKELASATACLAPWRSFAAWYLWQAASSKKKKSQDS